MHQSGHH